MRTLGLLAEAVRFELTTYNDVKDRCLEPLGDTSVLKALGYFA